jgi:hypothetical protein
MVPGRREVSAVTGDPTDPRGASVGLLCLDGVAKKPFLAELLRRLGDGGRTVRQVSWQRELAAGGVDGHNGEFPHRELERNWLDLYRLFFAEATIDGRPLKIPHSYSELARDGLMARLQAAEITGMRASAPLATGWLEMSGHTLLYYGVIGPMVARGDIVVQDSLGVKNILKSLFMAEYAGSLSPEAAVRVRRGVQRYFGGPLAPDVGVHLVEDPDDILAARIGAGIGLFDSYRAFGADTVASFVALQRSCAAEFAEFSAAHGWLRIDLRGATAGDYAKAAEQVVSAVGEQSSGPTA